MAPKKADPLAAPAVAAPPAPIVIPPHILAAQKVVEKWSERVDDAAKRMKETEDQIASLSLSRATREQRLKDLFSEVSVIVLPKPPEPEQPIQAGKGGKPAPKGKAVVEVPPPVPPQPLDEEDLKRMHKLQNAVIAIYKKKREKAPPRETPPSTAVSSVTEGGGRKAADTDAPADASPPTGAVDEPGIVKPADLDVEIWTQVLKLRDERIDTEEALATLKANLDIASARQQALLTLDNIVHYSLDAARFELEKAKETKPAAPPNAPAAGAAGPTGLVPQRPPSNPSSKQLPQRPPSQLLRR
jgi:hypothetical protein